MREVAGVQEGAGTGAAGNVADACPCDDGRQLHGEGPCGLCGRFAPESNPGGDAR